MEKEKLRDRLKYRFDNRMARGTGEMIKILAVVSIIVAVIAAIIICVFEYGGEDFSSSLWDTVSTIINAWMPYSDEGAVIYLVTTAVVAIFGVLFTSVLIGIISSAIEEKVDSLREGSSKVLEAGHTVLLGFTPGSYELINQLVMSKVSDKFTLVVAGDITKSEMEDYINENVAIPKNVKIICRKADITDPAALSILSLHKSNTIVINGDTDSKTVKSVLAVLRVLKPYGNKKEVTIIAKVSDDDYMLPETLRSLKNLTMIQSNEAIAKIMAHSCLQPGIAEAFTEMFNFEGSELYMSEIPELVGKSFAEILLSMDNATPIGFQKGTGTFTNPAPDMTLDNCDKVIYFSENKHSYKIVPAGIGEISNTQLIPLENDEPGKIVVIGFDETCDTMLSELPDTVESFSFAGCPASRQESIRSLIHGKNPNSVVTFEDINVLDNKELEKLVEGAAHVIILESDDCEDREAEDLNNMLTLLKLKDTKLRTNATFNITAELFYESNRALVSSDDTADFVVSSNITAMMLAQLANNPELYSVFDELLSNEGNELYVKDASLFGLESRTVDALELRRIALKMGYVLTGVITWSAMSINPPLDQGFTFKAGDKLIVIGED